MRVAALGRVLLVGGVAQRCPGVTGTAVPLPVAELAVVGEPLGPVHGPLAPGQFREELEGGRVAVGGLRHVRGARQRTVRLVAPPEEPVVPGVRLGAERGAPAVVGDRAEAVRGARPVLLAVRFGRGAVGDAVEDHHLRLVDRGDQFGQRVVLPAQDRPEGARVRGAQRPFDPLRGRADRHVARRAALVQQVHLEVRGLAEDVALMPVEGGGDLGEDGRARVEPVGALEAVPLALRYDARAGVTGHEAVRHGPVIAGEHGVHAQLPEPVRDPPAQRGTLRQQLTAERAAVRAEVLQQPPRLVGGGGQPGARLGVAVAEVHQHPVVDLVVPGDHQHLVAAVQREEVDPPLPERPVGVRGRVAVVGVVEREAVRQRRGSFQRAAGRGQPPGEVQLAAVPGEVGPADVLQVPVHAGQLHRRAGARHLDVPRPAGRPCPAVGPCPAGDLEALLAAVQRDEPELVRVPGKQPPQRCSRRGGGERGRGRGSAGGGVRGRGGGEAAEGGSGAERAGGPQQHASGWSGQAGQVGHGKRSLCAAATMDASRSAR